MNIHEQLIQANAQLHYACAGAGTEFIARLWQTPGSSQYLAGATLLQARQELEGFIGLQPDAGYCSQEVALHLATAAYQKAAVCTTNKQTPIGIAVTASVATNRLPRGEQRAHVALIWNQGAYHTQLDLQKATGASERRKHDRQIADLLEKTLSEALSEQLQPNADLAAIECLIKNPLFLPNGKRNTDDKTAALYFPGNFNPIHEGHLLACRQAEKIVGKRAVLTIEIQPPNKTKIALPDILNRIALTRKSAPENSLLITRNEANYIDKARTRPGSQFIVGADAVTRFLSPGWGYEVHEMLAELDLLKTAFFMLGRHSNDTLVTLDHIEIPDQYRPLFVALDGHVNISSTLLRKQNR